MNVPATPEVLSAAGLTLTVMTRDDADQTRLDQAALDLFALFKHREEAFSTSPAIVIDYPGTAAPSAFLDNPSGYVADRMNDLRGQGRAIASVVILSTFRERLAPPLMAAGWRHTPIEMPAGPDGTSAFKHHFAEAGDTLYIEAVDEADEKIRPAFVLELRDGKGVLRGGACGSLHMHGGAFFAYIATMTLDAGLPAGSGMALGHVLLTVLAERGVSVIHLGTQTAAAFYKKLGFRVTHTVLAGLRSRRKPDGALVINDLVMMEQRLLTLPRGGRTG